jgi:Tetracyclin repressor-like, C-terminal domain
MRSWTSTSPPLAFAPCRPDGVVETNAIAVIHEAIQAEMERGYEPPADAEVIAYAIVRMGESFLYSDAARGFRGDFDRLRSVYAALLGASRAQNHSEARPGS